MTATAPASKLPFQFKPDPQAASPLYMQLAHKLAQAIRDGHYHPDEALPRSGCCRNRWTSRA